MAIVSNPLIGKTRKSMGNATFTTWKGLNILKEKAINVANPKTEAQTIQRNKLKALVELYQYLSSAVLIGFKERAVKMSEYNAFVSANLRENVFNVVGSDVEVDYSKLIVSDGSLTPSAITSVSASEVSQELTVTFPTTLVGNQSSSDILNIAFKSDDHDYPEVILNAGDRSTGTASVSTTNTLGDGDTLNVYLFWSRADGSKVSDSYQEEITVS